MKLMQEGSLVRTGFTVFIETNNILKFHLISVEFWLQNICVGQRSWGICNCMGVNKHVKSKNPLEKLDEVWLEMVY